MAAPERILVIRLKCIGDVIFTLPFLHALRANYPEAHLSYLVSEELAPLLEGFAPVDACVTLNRARLRGGNPVGALAESLGLWRRLRRGRFSLAIDLQGYGETALLAWACGAPQRWGMLYRSSRRWAYTCVASRPKDRHPAECHLALLQASGIPASGMRNDFRLPSHARVESEVFFQQHRLEPSRTTIFIQPFTSSPGKNWPLENFLEIAGSLRQQGHQVLFGGGPADREALGPALQSGFPVSAGAPLLVTAGLMERSAVVLGGDTGVVHLAVALGKRVVMLMGQTGGGNSYPYLHPDWAVVPKPSQPLSSISPAAVGAACVRALAEQQVRVGRNS